jgi:pyruvate/2-oxoglutarate dehydrogenase complex dihydrolipoamide acyltransferase (E2) component
MQHQKGYQSRKLGFNRRLVRASISVTRQKNAIHSLTEIDISEPRRLIREHYDKTGEKLSLTAYIVACLAHTLVKHPRLNAFTSGNKLITLEDVTVNVLVEKEIKGESVPESIGIQQAQKKTFRQIHAEIRAAQQKTSDKMGGLSGQTWINLIPAFLLKTFIRLADRNLTMARRYGKVAVTAVGMHGPSATWFIPHGPATVLITVGSLTNKVVEVAGQFHTREHLCITASFDHDIVDGAPAARFLKDFTETVRSGALIE